MTKTRKNNSKNHKKYLKTAHKQYFNLKYIFHGQYLFGIKAERKGALIYVN